MRGAGRGQGARGVLRGGAGLTLTSIVPRHPGAMAGGTATHPHPKWEGMNPHTKWG